MDKVRFGIIGFGNMGSSHAKTLVEGNVEDGILTAIADTNPEKLKLAGEKYPEIKLFSNATDMYKSGEIDACIIAVPHYDHPPLAIEGFENNIHIMCEKPAGVYAKQVRVMNDAASKSDVVFGMMFNQRTNCVYRKMHEMVQNGELGEIKRTNWIITNWYRSQSYYDSGGWRATWAGEGGGVLLNQCPHNLDLWQWICGMPNKVTAFCHNGKWHNIEVEDDVTAYVEYPNGATGVFVTSTADAPGTNRFEILGTLGKLVCEDGEELTFYKLSESEREHMFKTKEGFKAPDSEKIEVKTDGLNPQHAGVLSAFAGKILGKGELIAGGEEGINGLILSNAMHLSSWLGKTVDLPIDDELFYQELKKRIDTSHVKENVSTDAVTDLSGTY